MSMNDPIADLLTRIRNAHLAKHDRLDVPASKLKIEICRILGEQGYIESFEKVEAEPRDLIRIGLKYTEKGEPAITRLRRVSKPGRRVYRTATDVQPVLNGLGVGIVSTSRGVLTDAQARRAGVGGEILCEIW